MHEISCIISIIYHTYTSEPTVLRDCRANASIGLPLCFLTNELSVLDLKEYEVKGGDRKDIDDIPLLEVSVLDDLPRVPGVPLRVKVNRLIVEGNQPPQNDLNSEPHFTIIKSNNNFI